MLLKKALIVEDDNRFRALLKRLLEKKFHMIVFEADNGIKGFELFKRETSNLDILSQLFSGHLFSNNRITTILD